MDKNKLIEIVLAEWTASFNISDKATDKARVRFEELFQKWKDVGATFDDLYYTYLPKAIKVHLPNKQVIKNTYKKFGHKTGKTFDEYAEDWNTKIESEAKDIFFDFFPALSEDDSEPKVYGNMSAAEYRAQRRYADQFPILDTTQLIKQWKAQQEYNLDVETVLENVLGGDDETKS